MTFSEKRIGFSTALAMSFIACSAMCCYGQRQVRKLDYLPVMQLNQGQNRQSVASSRPIYSQQQKSTDRIQRKNTGTDPSPSMQGDAEQRVKDGILHLPLCKVELIKKIEIPALESGALSQLHVLQGDSVPINLLLAMVDNQSAETEMKMAKARLVAAQTQIDNDIAVRAAKAAFDKAKSKYDRDSRLVRRKGISKEEMEESQLEMIHSNLQVEKATVDRIVESKKIEVEKFNVQKAEGTYHRHKVLSPWAGTVGKIHKYQGEWVNAGDTILELLQMEELWVEARVLSRSADPHELIDKPVTVTVEQARGKFQKVVGQVVFVDVEKDGAGYLSIRAKVPNKRLFDHWLLLPGGNVKMDIHLNQPARTSMRNRKRFVQ